MACADLPAIGLVFLVGTLFGSAVVVVVAGWMKGLR